MGALLKTTPVTVGLAILTVLASLYVEVTGQAARAAVAAGFMPLRATIGFASDLPGFVPVLLTPLSATLVHGGLLHLGMNMVMLVYIGVMVERATGSLGAAVLYLVGAYAAAAAQWVPDPQSMVPMVGASGAVSAFVGAYALLYGRSKTRSIGPVPAGVLHALWLLAAWTVLNLLVSLLGARAGMPIAAAAHIGGFMAGLALARPLLIVRWRGA